MSTSSERETGQHQGVSSKPLRLPARLEVAEVLESRYSSSLDKEKIAKDQWFVPELQRPLSWDDRVEGVDVVRAASGEVLRLRSSGMQSVPKPGWVVVLTSGDEAGGYTWTLYGLPTGFADWRLDRKQLD